MLRITEASYSYPAVDGGAPVCALDGVSLELAPGDHVVVLGPNGSGKSTLARLCDGLLLPDEGSVTVDGLDTRDPESAWLVRSRVGIVFQNPDNQIVGTSIEEDVAFGPENLGLPREDIRSRVDEALAAVGLAGLERREPHTLSEGQKQRLAIAGALAMRPGYVVLDEPTSMLDPDGRAAVLDAVARLRSEGRGILHVTHHVGDAAGADRVLALVGGREAYAGPPDGLLVDPVKLRSCGLEMPPLAALVASLRAAGVALPEGALDAEGLVRAL